MRLPTWTYLIVFGIGILLCWYVMHGCQEEAPDHSGDIKIIDSLTALNDIHTKETLHFRDSTELVILSLSKDKDSLLSLTKEYKIDLNQRGKKIQGLLDDLNEAEATKDTLRQLAGCDSLRVQVGTTKGIVGVYIHANDSLQKVNNQIIASNTEIKNRLASQLTESNNTLFATQLTLQRVETDYNKLKGQKSKRFAIGPSIGYYITPNGSGIGFGVSLTYTPIKF